MYIDFARLIKRPAVLPTCIAVLLCSLHAALSATNTPPDQLLLKDYRPQSIFNLPQTRPERARYPVIDAHSHAYARTPDQVAQWVRNMDAVGIQKTIILSGATGKAFDDCIRLYQQYSNRFDVWCGIDYTGADEPGFANHAMAELERCAKAGARGVGELSDKGRGLRSTSGASQASPLHLDDARLDPILDLCANLELPVNIHVGEDRWMYEPMDSANDGLMNAFKWRIPKAPGVLEHDAVVATLERAVKKHPHTTFVACHFANCCSDLSILGHMFDACPNLFADISARYAETAPIPRYMLQFYERYQDRLLYGTDLMYEVGMYRATFRILETEDEHFYSEFFRKYHWPLHGFGLRNPVLKKVYADNAARILSLGR